jgi:hypothetical protein
VAVPWTAEQFDRRVPDVAGEIFGWKVLALADDEQLYHASDDPHHIVIPTTLASPLEHALWPRHDWLYAVCTAGDPDHQPPVEDCTCGIYAVAEPHSASEYVWDAPLSVLARVALAGKVIPGTRGWRAERARIVALTHAGKGAKDYPALFARAASGYGVPIVDLPELDRPDEAGSSQ